MIIVRNEKLFFSRADSIRIGDLMLVDERIAQVISIKNHTIDRKVAIETEDGTLQVNGVWASGLCDDNVNEVNRVVEHHALVEEYKKTHFGDEYNYMCMDTRAWRNAYMRNNGMLE